MDALLCADISQRLYSTCACVDGDWIEKGKQDSSELQKFLLASYVEGEGKVCCGGRADVDIQEGRDPVLLGGVPCPCGHVTATRSQDEFPPSAL